MSKINSPDTYGVGSKNPETLLAEIDTLPMLYALGLSGEENGVNVADTRNAIRKVQAKPTMLDVPTFNIRGKEAILNFLRGYNIDLNIPTDALRMLQTMEFAMDFLSEDVLPMKLIRSSDGSDSLVMDSTSSGLEDDLAIMRKKISFDSRVLTSAIESDMNYSPSTPYCFTGSERITNSYNREDILNYFSFLVNLVNSTHEHSESLKKQACAILRIMRAVDYKDTYTTSEYVDAARSQLLRKVCSVSDVRDHELIVDSKSAEFSLPSPATLYGIPVHSVIVRQKTDKSLVTKLLHSEKYGDTPPMDFVGIRIVTKNREDAMRLFYQLFFGPRSIVHSSRIHVGQTKNLLFNPNKLRDLLKDPEKSLTFFTDQSRSHDFDFDTDPDVTDLSSGGNLLSSNDYRALHIVVDLPIRTNRHTVSIPVELQLTDKVSELRNDRTHPTYKEKQKLRLYKRLFGRKPPYIP